VTERDGARAGTISFESLLERYDWKPIPGCPGRYILKGGISPVKPAALVGGDREIREREFTAAPDPVSFCLFPGGGLVSFRKKEGYIHTLCDAGGFERKMRKLKGNHF
jgi:hypothetical protein